MLDPGWELDFGRLQGHITEALAYTGSAPTHRLGDIRDGIAEGRFQMWPGAHSIVITEVHQTPRKRVLHFFLAGGSLLELKMLEPVIEEWGRMQGCTAATFTGRRGFERTFLTRERGWAADQVLFSKEL